MNTAQIIVIYYFVSGYYSILVVSKHINYLKESFYNTYPSMVLVPGKLLDALIVIFFFVIGFMYMPISVIVYIKNIPYYLRRYVQKVKFNKHKKSFNIQILKPVEDSVLLTEHKGSRSNFNPPKLKFNDVIGLCCLTINKNKLEGDEFYIMLQGNEFGLFVNYSHVIENEKNRCILSVKISRKR